MIDIKSLRIVAADDDDLNLFILLKCIQDAGHIATGFPEGNVTWEYLSSHPGEVDLVILDKMMAKMSGIEVIQRMKAHPLLKNIPVILQTGDAVPERIKEGLDAGADRYITKPFSPDQLMEIVQEEVIKYGHNFISH
jgi:chemotaxis family two-component system response regulator PixG